MSSGKRLLRRVLVTTGGPVGYWHVEDIEKSLQALFEAGAEAQQGVKDVGGGKLIASVKDADGNVIGLIQSA